MKLSNILQNLDITESAKLSDIEITSIEHDSRKVKENSIFICIKGEKLDGHDYIQEVIEKGAKVIIVDSEFDYSNFDASFVKVKDTRIAMAKIACNFYENPSKRLKMIGVTGTKGKTTTTFMIKSILEKAGKKVGLVGTVYNMIGNKKFGGNNTTPGAIEIQSILARMIKENVDVVVMEVSSHALDMNRVDGIEFDVGIFTNLTPDHLDYHMTMENYFNAKAKLFTMSKLGFVNCDDIYSLKIERMATCPITTYGLDNGPKIYAKDLIISNNYVEFKVMVNNRPEKIRIAIPGRFTVYNALAAISAASALNTDFEYIKQGLEEVVVPGRSEMVHNSHGKLIMIDYAYTPDSLEHILKALKSYVKGKIICVFGCEGDRDGAKRPIMGEISGRLAGLTILTTDNPRTEEPTKIINEILVGVKKTKGEYKIVINRKGAIKHALQVCGKHDLILLAGKGHETYQALKDKTIHFDEREIVKQLLKEMPIPEEQFKL